MEYIGRLFGRVAGKYFDTGKTSEDWDILSEFKLNSDTSIKIPDSTFEWEKYAVAFAEWVSRHVLTVRVNGDCQWYRDGYKTTSDLLSLFKESEEYKRLIK